MTQGLCDVDFVDDTTLYLVGELAIFKKAEG